MQPQWVRWRQYSPEQGELTLQIAITWRRELRVGKRMIREMISDQLVLAVERVHLPVPDHTIL